MYNFNIFLSSICIFVSLILLFRLKSRPNNPELYWPIDWMIWLGTLCLIFVYVSIFVEYWQVAMSRPRDFSGESLAYNTSSTIRRWFRTNKSIKSHVDTMTIVSLSLLGIVFALRAKNTKLLVWFALFNSVGFWLMVLFDSIGQTDFGILFGNFIMPVTVYLGLLVSYSYISYIYMGKIAK